MISHANDDLHRAAIQTTIHDRSKVGCWLHRHQLAENLSIEDLAVKLGITLRRLAILSLCALPRRQHFSVDLLEIAELAELPQGAASTLATILRLEIAVAKHEAKTPVDGTVNRSGMVGTHPSHDETPLPPYDSDEDTIRD